jgi:SAM-dependent methyltransferase
MRGDYDRIGRGYTVTRRPDPRIARAIGAALGDARTVLNVGAGAGSYEPREMKVVAVEPSIEMIRQRAPGSAPAVRARAEALPFRDGSFDAALAVLTLHHWGDWQRGLVEMRRVARRRAVVLTCDPGCGDSFWLIAHYLPEIAELDAGRLPPIGELARCLGKIRVEAVMVPRDCQDGFQGAFWERPEAYLDPAVRRGMSSFALLAPEVVKRGLERLAADLRSGQWEARFGHLRSRRSMDLGYRLIIAELGN